MCVRANEVPTSKLDRLEKPPGQLPRPLADEKEMKREKYLEAFFGALGEKSFVIKSARPDRIVGTVLYDEHEEQDFCWSITEEQVPSESAYLLLKLLQEQKLIEIDRIMVPRKELQ